jgi:hypothetical protein
MTFLADFRATRLTVALVVDGAIKDELCLRWVSRCLVPTLQPGHVVVMDNAHKAAGIREAIKAAETLLVYLPSYSPGLNLMDLVFSSSTWLLKSASARARPAYV